MGSTDKVSFTVLPVGTMGFQVIRTQGGESAVYCEVSTRWSVLSATEEQCVDEARGRAEYIAMALREAGHE